MQKVLIIDTSILCVYLKVPFMEECGPNNDKWDYNRVCEKINYEIAQKSLLVLPLAALIETGNHIAHVSGERYGLAKDLSEIIIKAATAEEPWAAFTSQNELWSEKNLRKLADDWSALAAEKLSIGDMTIKNVAEFYTESGFRVEILTGDGGLKAYEPEKITVPRRRR